MSARAAIKRAVQGLCLAASFPFALLSGFGRMRAVYLFFAHLHALLPGMPGDYLRSAYYRLTLRECAADVRVGFGTFFVHPTATVGDHVSIGSYCVIGRARIGRRTQIASHVEIPSGRHQHTRDAGGRLTGSLEGETVIGPECWIGASAIVMADVGAGTTIGAGAVVVREIPAGVVAAGNPARVLRSVAAGQDTGP